VITNAIYFKGAWANAFNKANTQEEDFHLLGGSGTVKAKMMKQTKLKARYSRFSDHAMLQLPYKGNNVVMLVMLPHENSPSALEAVRALPLAPCVYKLTLSCHTARVSRESEEHQQQ